MPEDKNAKREPLTQEPRYDQQFLRAANEDDDGYDPYSDRVERTPLFERDPWN